MAPEYYTIYVIKSGLRAAGLNWTTSAFVPIHKKGSTKKCENYRTICLICHASKILLRIIEKKLHNFLESQIPPEQADFVRGRGTRDQIFNVRQLIEEARKFNTPMSHYKKDFDCVKWNGLWNVLKKMEIPQYILSLLKNLY